MYKKYAKKRKQSVLAKIMLNLIQNSKADSMVHSAWSSLQILRSQMDVLTGVANNIEEN